MSVKRIALSCLITGCLLITAQGFGFDLDVIFGKYLSMEDIQKLVDSREYDKAAVEYWKRIKFNNGDEEAYSALRKIAKEAVAHRTDNIMQAAEKLAQKRGLATRRYLGNVFILVQDDNELVERIYKSRNSMFKSWNTVLLECVQSLYPSFTYIGKNTGKKYLLKSFNSEETAVPFLTMDIVKKDFPSTRFSPGEKSGLFFADSANPQKLIPARAINRVTYQEKIAAFVRLCQFYGAKRVKLTRLSSQKTEILIGKKADISTVTGGDAQAEINGGSSYEELFYCDHLFSGIREKGNPPESPWLHDEFKDFRIRCESKNRIKQEEVTLEYSESIGLSASFIASLSNFGIDIGFKVGKSEKYRCSYTVYFED